MPTFTLERYVFDRLGETHFPKGLSGVQQFVCLLVACCVLIRLLAPLLASSCVLVSLFVPLAHSCFNNSFLFSVHLLEFAWVWMFKQQTVHSCFTRQRFCCASWQRYAICILKPSRNKQETCWCVYVLSCYMIVGSARDVETRGSGSSHAYRI